MHRRQFTGTARAMRGVVLGSTLFVLTVSGHMAAGGGHALLTSTWLLPVMIVLSAALADRQRSLPWLLAYLVGAEALFHVVLSVSLGHDGRVVSAAPSTSMVLAHVMAAALAALAIHHADGLLHRWLEFVEALTQGPPLHVRVISLVESVQPTSAGFAVNGADATSWQGLRAPPSRPA